MTGPRWLIIRRPQYCTVKSRNHGTSILRKHVITIHCRTLCHCHGNLNPKVSLFSLLLPTDLVLTEAYRNYETRLYSVGMLAWMMSYNILPSVTRKERCNLEYWQSLFFSKFSSTNIIPIFSRKRAKNCVKERRKQAAFFAQRSGIGLSIFYPLQVSLEHIEWEKKNRKSCFAQRGISLLFSPLFALSFNQSIHASSWHQAFIRSRITMHGSLLSCACFSEDVCFALHWTGRKSMWFRFGIFTPKLHCAPSSSILHLGL